ncbi:hypothetical protein ABG816_05965 [Streptococcus agalactiae]
MVKFFLTNSNDNQSSMLKPKVEKLNELDRVTGLADFKNAVKELISYL